MSTVNTQMFMQVREYILAEPEHIDMRMGIAFKQGCGTVGCIAGTCCFLSTQATRKRKLTTLAAIMKEAGIISCLFGSWRSNLQRQGYTELNHWFEVKKRAQSILGIADEETQRLFHFYSDEIMTLPPAWAQLRAKLKATQPYSAEYAAVVVEAIDLFLTEKGFDVPKLVAEYHAELGRKVMKEHLDQHPDVPVQAPASTQPEQVSLLEQIIKQA